MPLARAAAGADRHRRHLALLIVFVIGGLIDRLVHPDRGRVGRRRSRRCCCAGDARRGSTGASVSATLFADAAHDRHDLHRHHRRDPVRDLHQRDRHRRSPVEPRHPTAMPSPIVAIIVDGADAAGARLVPRRSRADAADHADLPADRGGSWGYSPIWFGIFLVRTMEIGFVHPPLGLNVYVIHGMAKDIPLATIFRGIVPFLVVDFLHLAMLIAVPVGGALAALDHRRLRLRYGIQLLAAFALALALRRLRRGAAPAARRADRADLRQPLPARPPVQPRRYQLDEVRRAALAAGASRFKPFWSGALLSCEQSMEEIRHGVADIGLITPIYARAARICSAPNRASTAASQSSTDQVAVYECLAARFPAVRRRTGGAARPRGAGRQLPRHPHAQPAGALASPICKRPAPASAQRDASNCCAGSVPIRSTCRWARSIRRWPRA